MSRQRYTVAVDFDGVLHAYDSPWVNAHTIPDGPVPGAIEWLHATLQVMDVVIYSTRCRTWRGRWAVRRWLKRYAGGLWWPDPACCRGLEDVRLSYEKPPALAYLDDRAWRFNGLFPHAQTLIDTKPWNKDPAKRMIAEHLREESPLLGLFRRPDEARR